jgi:DNA topoisomerase-2
LTSSNYDDTEEREGAGTNGIGAKAVNIFSTEFEVKIVNGGKEYTQVWRNNMAERGEPKIKSTQSSKEYVRISAKPDWAKFDMEKLSSNRTLSVLEQRAYEISALCPDKQVSVSINGKKIPVKSFEDYVNLYLGKDKKEVPRVFGEVSDWQVCVAANPYDDFVQISTVNGCHTRDGGTHVDIWTKSSYGFAATQTCQSETSPNTRGTSFLSFPR